MHIGTNIAQHSNESESISKISRLFYFLGDRTISIRRKESDGIALDRAAV